MFLNAQQTPEGVPFHSSLWCSQASVQKPVPSPEAHPILQRIRHTRRCDLNRCVATAKANLMQARVEQALPGSW